ncbi:MAG: response regulator transcription factor [Chloroflexota bacterium]
MTSRSKRRITVVLADDEPVVRAGLCTMLSQSEEIEVIGDAQDGFEAQRLVTELRPQILLLDLKMPGPRPAELEGWVRENHPETVTLVLTAHDRDAYLAGMMDAGAAGYLSKNASADRLIDAIRRAAQGAIVFDEEQISRAANWKKNISQKWESLSEREQQVLRLAGCGEHNKTIAASLCITPKAVEKHLTSVYRKLGLNSRVEAIIWWEKNGGDFPT